MLAHGEGTPTDFRAGVATLKRACEAGNDDACKNRDTVAGTGLVSTHSPPNGAVGFTFGWSEGEATRACAESHGRWTAEVSSCEEHISAIDRDGLVLLKFIRGRISSINASYEVRAGEAGSEFARVAKLLAEIYGPPSYRTVEVSNECGTKPLALCLRAKQAEFSTSWELHRKDDVYLVSLSLMAAPDDTLSLMLLYTGPEEVRAAGNPGL
jgi:hypothetical protein